MSNGAHRRQRRRRGSGRSQARPGGLVKTYRPFASHNGAPVYDGTLTQPLVTDEDGRVVLGIGPSGGTPVAWVLLCPCDGVDGLVRDLQAAAAIAAEHHPPHDYPMSIEADDT